jgi:hypothetical protein
MSERGREGCLQVPEGAAGLGAPAWSHAGDCRLQGASQHGLTGQSSTGEGAHTQTSVQPGSSSRMQASACMQQCMQLLEVTSPASVAGHRQHQHRQQQRQL